MKTRVIDAQQRTIILKMPLSLLIVPCSLGFLPLFHKKKMS